MALRVLEEVDGSWCGCAACTVREVLGEAAPILREGVLAGVRARLGAAVDAEEDYGEPIGIVSGAVREWLGETEEGAR